MNNGPIPAGTKSSLKGMRPTLKSSEESKFLYLVIQELRNLGGVITNSAMGPATVAFTVDNGTDAPISGNTNWIINTVNLANKTPTFLRNGTILLSGTDYNWVPNLYTFVLLSGTFVTTDIYTIVF